MWVWDLGRQLACSMCEKRMCIYLGESEVQAVAEIASVSPVAILFSAVVVECLSGHIAAQRKTVLPKFFCN